VALLLLRFRNHSSGFVAKSVDVRTSKKLHCEERCGIAADIGMKIKLALSVPCFSGSNAPRIPPGLGTRVPREGLQGLFAIYVQHHRS